MTREALIKELKLMVNAKMFAGAADRAIKAAIEELSKPSPTPSRRDEIASRAMAQLIPLAVKDDYGYIVCARESIRYADALIAELGKEDKL